jgi:hypothetical protein
MKDLNETKNLLKRFLVDYDEEKKDQIWENQSKFFRVFWDKKILDSKKDLQDSEIDAIVSILDRNGKGNTKDSEAVAKVMNPQGVWRRQFREMQSNKTLQSILDDIFRSSNQVPRVPLIDEIFYKKGSKYGLDQIFRIPTLATKAKLIDELYDYNKNRKNGLTGGSGNVLNSMMFAFDPKNFLSVISLKDRLKVIAYFGFPELGGYDKSTMGQRIVATNASIIEGFRAIGLTNSIRTLSCFLYSPVMQGTWREEFKKPKKASKGKTQSPIVEEEEPQEIGNDDAQRFGMEDELEDFLVANWERTELGKKYDIYEEDGDLGQQYKTDIGRIDILAVEKKTKKLVVIELKRGRTSDVAVGQLIRYMGWLEEHKTNGKSTKGIIIALEHDPSLYYAAKKVQDVEIFTYKVSFSLEAYKKPL